LSTKNPNDAGAFDFSRETRDDTTLMFLQSAEFAAIFDPIR
jgi:hypothetical protein